MKLRNGTILTLMAVSIALLLVLQVLWLQNSYEKAFYDLRRDTNFIFRNTLSAVRDSLFAKNIRPIDSLVDPESIKSVQIFNRQGADSMRIQMKASTVQVYVSGATDKDSIVTALQPFSRHITQPMKNGRSFLIRLESDSIRIDSLENIFGIALKQAGFPVKFNLSHKHSPPSFNSLGRRMDITRIESAPPENKQNFYSNTITLDPVRLNSVNVYSATLISFEGFILKNISLQILFSVLLTLVITVAFFVLYKSVRSQQRLMELKNDFISNVTHELKTPVATVSVAIEALKNFHALDNPAKTLEYLEIAQKELNRLTLMTDKILKTSVFENQELSLQLEKVDLVALIESVLSSLKLVVEKQSATVLFEKGNGDFSIRGDAAHITNMMFNLIDNALKYNRDNTEIKISMKHSTNGLLLSVEDNGIGIAPEYHKKVFEKFFRIPTGDVHNTRGYGLGLSYVASVVKNHGGTIKIDSGINKGSTFIIYLPYQHGTN